MEKTEEKPLTEKERNDAFISGYAGTGTPEDVRSWLKRHPDGRMCSFDYCRCKQ